MKNTKNKTHQEKGNNLLPNTKYPSISQHLTDNYISLFSTIITIYLLSTALEILFKPRISLKKGVLK